MNVAKIGGVVAVFAAAVVVAAPGAYAQWASPEQQTAAVRSAKEALTRLGVRGHLEPICRYDVVRKSPRAAAIRCTLSLQLRGGFYGTFPSNLPRWNKLKPDVAGFRTWPYEKDVVDYFYPVPYAGEAGLDSGVGDSVTINGTTYSL